MLPLPPQILTGPKGGHYVELASGRHYVGEEYGKGREKAPLETTRITTSADAAWKKARDFKVPNLEVVKEKELPLGVGKVWTVAAPGAGIAQYNQKVSTPQQALFESKSLVERALTSNEHAKQFAVFANEKIAELRKIHGNDPRIQPHIDRLKEDQQEAETSRDNMLALAQRVYDDYVQKSTGVHGLPIQKSPLIAYAVQKHFDDLGLGDVHRKQTTSWKSSSSSEGAMRLHGALQAIGVPGTLGYKYMRQDEVNEREKAFFEGKEDPKTQQYVREMYSLSQAALRDAGVGEVTLYRGVTARQEVPPAGTKIHVETRPASSWTDKAETASAFAAPRGHVLKTTVPASAVYSSHLLFGNHSNENEFVVLGATRFETEVVQ